MEKSATSSVTGTGMHAEYICWLPTAAQDSGNENKLSMHTVIKLLKEKRLNWNKY